MCKCVVLAGPTAVGKTELSIKLAKLLDAEIISADASQVYKELDIGTAKISEDQMQGIRHHLIDVADLNENFSAGKYSELVNEILNSSNKTYILVGGTGLYIDAVTLGLSEQKKVDETLRKELNQKDLESLCKILENKNIYLSEEDKKNKQRLIRKIEKGSSSEKRIKGNNREFLNVFLTRSRENIYDRINKRVDIMIKQGLIEEAKEIFKKNQDIKAIGYKELFMHFKGEIDLKKSIEDIKTNSRRYAKRQFTWFKNKGYHIYDMDKLSQDEIIEDIRRKLCK